jgi:Mrp family chromosome partitioning ATPase
VQLRALVREAKSQRDLLESYLARYREATARENIDAVPAEARVISRATVSNVPAFPKKLPILIVTTLATLFLAAAFVLSTEIMRQGASVRLRSPFTPAVSAEPLTADTPVPTPSRTRRSLLSMFGRKKPEEIPTAPVEPALDPVAADSAVEQPAVPAVAESVESIARNLLTLGESGRRVTIVGAARDVGTTSAALALSRALLAQGGSVVLADLALTAPNLSIVSVDPYAPGFAELVRGAAAFGDIITRDRFSRLHLVSTGRVLGDAKAILSSPRLAITLEALARAYDHLLIDAGSIPEISIGLFAQIAPRAVLVVGDPLAPGTEVARRELDAAGFVDVAMMQGLPGRAATTEPVAA